MDGMQLLISYIGLTKTGGIYHLVLIFSYPIYIIGITKILKKTT